MFPVIFCICIHGSNFLRTVQQLLTNQFASTQVRPWSALSLPALFRLQSSAPGVGVQKMGSLIPAQVCLPCKVLLVVCQNTAAVLLAFFAPTVYSPTCRHNE